MVLVATSSVVMNFGGIEESSKKCMRLSPLTVAMPVIK